MAAVRSGARVGVPPWASAWGPAVVAFAAVRLFLLAAAVGHHVDGLSADTWARWDSFQYLSIANNGFTLGASDGRNNNAPVGTPIGNAGWAPGYPLLVRWLTRAGVGQMSAAMWLSGATALLMLRAVDRLLPADLPPGRRWATVLLAAFFPGFVYAHAVFPLSIEVLLLAVTVRTTAAGRWTVGGLAGAGAAFAYTSGYLIGPVMGAWAALPTTGGKGPSAVRRAARMVGPALLPLAGLGAILAMQRAALGRWDGLYLIQRAHGLAYANPARVLWRYLAFVNSVDRAQVPFVAGLVVCVVTATAARWGRRTAVERLLAVAALAFWIAPLSLGAGLSPWRPMTVLTAFVPPLAARRLPTLALWALLAACLVMGWAMCGRFLDWTAV